MEACFVSLCSNFIMMKPYWLWILFPAGFYTSCSDPAKPKQDRQPVAGEPVQTRTKPPSSFSDTLIISPNTAVFYFPDSLQDLHIKAVTDPGVYKSIVHENEYQMRYSRKVLKQYYQGISVRDARNIRYLAFHKKDGEYFYLDLNTKNDAYGLLVFDGVQKPELLDMTNVETELSDYFKH
jgi:hypothetical protein